MEEEKERLLLELQRKVASLERRLEGNLSQDEHLQEFLQEVNHSFRAACTARLHSITFGFIALINGKWGAAPQVENILRDATLRTCFLFNLKRI